MDFARLKKILEVNYKALGFTLESFEVEHKNGLHVALGILRCPCSGTEHFLSALDPIFSESSLAERILKQTASEAHLREDVEAGKLPTFDYKKHVFKELQEVNYE